DAVAVGDQPVTRSMAQEQQAVVAEGMEHRQVDALAGPGGPFQQRGWIDLAVVGQVQGDMAGAAVEQLPAENPRQPQGGAAWRRGGQGAAGRAHGGADLRLAGGHGPRRTERKNPGSAALSVALNPAVQVGRSRNASGFPSGGYAQQPWHEAPGIAIIGSRTC